MAKQERGDSEISLEGKMVGFLGFGFMAQSLAKGFIRNKVLNPNHITYFDNNPDLLQNIPLIPDFSSCIALHSNQEVLDSSDIIIIAVKPQVALSLLEGIKADRKKHLFISICAGVTLRQLEESLSGSVRVVRTMPNNAVSVGFGTTVICGGRWATPEDSQTTCKLFSSVGLCLSLPEKDLNVVTAISGCGPAYAYMGIDAAGDAGCLLGLPKSTAQQLAAYTMMGAAKMFLESSKHPGPLKDSVCSPGGTTLAGVRCLEKGAFRSLIMETIIAGHNRSRQLEDIAANVSGGGGAGGSSGRSTAGGGSTGGTGLGGSGGDDGSGGRINY